MKLLIDAGNSMIKWALAEKNHILQQGNLLHFQANKLNDLFHKQTINSVWGSIVASDNLGQEIENSCPIKINWVTSERSSGNVRNHYKNINEHGSDRWLAILALQEKNLGDCVLASLGTALTVEALTAEGDYLGGIIIPGISLMLDALSSGTARLTRFSAEWSEFPKTTPEAMTSGALEAIAGAIERMHNRLLIHTKRSVSLILTGGDAHRLLPLLAPSCQIMDNLVIHGLLKVSNRT